MPYIFALLLFFFSALGAPDLAQASAKIIYIPLDDRPVCLRYTVDTLEAAGIKLSVPPKELLASRYHNAQVESLWQWLRKEAPSADYAVIATDALLYGGLVASRQHILSQETLSQRLNNFTLLTTACPNLTIYAFSSLLRTPRGAIGSLEQVGAASYLHKLFLLSAYLDRQEVEGLTDDDYVEVMNLEDAIPEPVLSEWRTRRKANYRLNLSLMYLASQGQFTHFAIGKDDNAPFSATHQEMRHLLEAARQLECTNFSLVPGIDQVGLLLLARIVAAETGKIPNVKIIYATADGPASVPPYSDESVEHSLAKQLALLGAERATNTNVADLILAINTPEGGNYHESDAFANAPYPTKLHRAFVTTLRSYIDRPIALADIAYANGGDNGLLTLLEEQVLLYRLYAYSGWNTADNSLGYALAQGYLATIMDETKRRQLLTVRYADDWLYEANVRMYLGHHLDFHLSGRLRQDLANYHDYTAQLCQEYFQLVNPKAFPHLNISFPWERLFDIDVGIRNEE